MPTPPSLCPGEEEKGCYHAERFSTERASAGSWGIYMQEEKPDKKECLCRYVYLCSYMHIYMYVIMLSPGETKWIGYSLDVLKLGFM